MIKTEQRQFESWVLTSEGTEIVESGSHEARLFNAVDPETGALQAELMVRREGREGGRESRRERGREGARRGEKTGEGREDRGREWEKGGERRGSNCLFHVCPDFVQQTGPHAKVGFSKAMSSGWLRIDKKAEGGPRVFRKVREPKECAY